VIDVKSNGVFVIKSLRPACIAAFSNDTTLTLRRAAKVYAGRRS